MHEYTKHVMASFVSGMATIPSVMWRDIVEVGATPHRLNILLHLEPQQPHRLNILLHMEPVFA